MVDEKKMKLMKSRDSRVHSLVMTSDLTSYCPIPKKEYIA